MLFGAFDILAFLGVGFFHADGADLAVFLENFLDMVLSFDQVFGGIDGHFLEVLNNDIVIDFPHLFLVSWLVLVEEDSFSRLSCVQNFLGELGCAETGEAIFARFDDFTLSS